MKLKLFFLTTLAILFLPVSVLAATFSIQLAQPKSPTKLNNLKLTFVAGTIDPDLVITVKCFKKGPSDISYSQFDIDKVMIPGGNTDVCEVTNSIMSAEGIYSFYVTATADATTLTSSTVTVNYNTSGPDTPSSYSKEWLNNCDYKIKFKTADDGKTVKVELFRSDTRSISLDSGGRVATLTIAPNTEGEITNSVPTCGKEYYYVLRAVDSADNVSGTTGDSFTTTTTTTTTETTVETQSAIPVNTDGTQVTGGATTETIEGATPEITGETLLSTDSATPEVLGTETTKYSYLKWIFLTVVAFAIFQLLTHKKRA